MGLRAKLVVAFCLLLAVPSANAGINACDLVTPDGVDFGDVQAAFAMAAGLLTCTANIVGPNICDAAMVNRVIVAAMGGPCNIVGPHSATLNWTRSVSPGITNNKIYRSTVSPVGPYTLINTVGDVNTYVDTQVVAGVTYYYVVTAVDNTGAESDYSNWAKGTIPKP